ncbi:MAG: hypothetical protein JW809_17090 [Pirellulales bacterium]|nr:hypothetical protein [Pirellulales bacterium]
MPGLTIPREETIHFDVVTHNPKTGAVTDADSTPTFEVFEEGIDTPIWNGDLSKRTDKTGQYRGSFVAAGAYGFDVGKFYNVVATAAVGGVTGKSVALVFRVVAEEPAAGKPALDNNAIADAVLARDVGQAESSAAEHSLCTVVLATLESAIAGSTWTIKRTDGVTVHATKSVTTDPDAEPVTLLRAGSGEATPIATALATALRRREAEASAGLYRETDVVWHLNAAEMPRPPEPGDTIVDAAGRRFTILSVAPAAGGSRWRCVARETQIAPKLDQHVDIQRATWSKGQHGAAVPRWRAWRSGVPAKIQPVAFDANERTSGAPTVRYVVYLDHDGVLDDTYRLRAPDGTLLRVVGCRKAQRLDALVEVEVVVSDLAGGPFGEH